MNRTQEIKGRERRHRTWLLLALGLVAAFALAACSSANGDGNKPPEEPKPNPNTALELTDDVGFQYLPGAQVTELEWEIEVKYNTQNVRAVFDHYEAALTDLGFTLVEKEKDHQDEIEAEYLHAGTGVRADLEVELDYGRVEVELEFKDPKVYEPTDTIPPFGLLGFGDFEVPVYPGATVFDVEWDFGFFHPTEDPLATFEHYDQVLQDLGWVQTEIDNDPDDEWEADYRQDGVHLELEVEAERGGAEVEIEVNKRRFYQGQN